jgi:hypothetical protein
VRPACTPATGTAHPTGAPAALRSTSAEIKAILNEANRAAAIAANARDPAKQTERLLVRGLRAQSLAPRAQSQPAVVQLAGQPAGPPAIQPAC